MRIAIAATLLLACCTSKQTIGVAANLPEMDVTVPMHIGGKVDVLFMVDDSPSMSPMQGMLRAHFGDLVNTVTQIQRGGPLDLHIGVVTSDYGAGDTAGGGCAASPGGTRGMLQALGAGADANCKPPTGAPFIQYAIDDKGAVTTSNLPSGQTLDQTFTCMATVGSGGCGFEHQLESVYAALHGDAVTSGFLRDDASITIVFLTNEDDGSAAPNARFYEQAADPNSYGAYDTFRQTLFALACDGHPIPYGAGHMFKSCTGAPNPTVSIDAAYDVSRYVSFFTQPRASGGLKDQPWDVALVAIAPPAMPVETLLVQKGTGLGLPPNPDYVPCGPSLSQNCLERLKHSCQNHADPTFFGDPAVRLASVVEQATVHQLASICGDDPNSPPDFTGAMSGVGRLMASQATGGCLFRAPVEVAHPRCNVTVGEGTAAQTLPTCANGTASCWRLQTDLTCPLVRDPATGGSEQLRLTVVGADPAHLHASCRVYSESP
jgi:hypothetical protein